MLWTLLLVLLIMWALGLGFGVAGNLIHVLLVVAVIVLIVNLLQGRTAIQQLARTRIARSAPQLGIIIEQVGGKSKSRSKKIGFMSKGLAWSSV